MGIEVTSKLLTKQVSLPFPMSDNLLPLETKQYQYVEFDEVMNDARVLHLIAVQAITVKSLDPLDQEVVFADGWDEEPKLTLGPYKIWVDALGNYRMHFGEPSSDLDGVIIGPSASSTAEDQLAITGLDTSAMGDNQAAYVSSDLTVSPTDCSRTTGTFLTATFAGVYIGIPGKIVNVGKAVVRFDAGLSPAPVAGEVANLSWVNAGQFRNDAPQTGLKDFMTKAGIILDASTYATTQTCTILLQPAKPIKV